MGAFCIQILIYREDSYKVKNATFCEKWRKKLLWHFVKVAVEFEQTLPSFAQIEH